MSDEERMPASEPQEQTETSAEVVQGQEMSKAPEAAAETTKEQEMQAQEVPAEATQMQDEQAPKTTDADETHATDIASDISKISKVSEDTAVSAAPDEAATEAADASADAAHTHEKVISGTSIFGGTSSKGTTEGTQSTSGTGMSAAGTSAAGTSASSTSGKQSDFGKKLKKAVSWLLDSFIGTFAVGFILMNIGQILGTVIFELAGVQERVDPDLWDTMSIYLSFTGIWLIFPIYMLITKKNRPILKALGPGPKGNNLKGLGTGLLIGFVMNLFCAVVAIAHGDVTIHYDGFNLKWFLIVFVAVFIQSSAEELVCRVFIHQRLVKRYKHVWPAAVLNSVLFGLLHLSNPGVTRMAIINIIVTGLAFSAMVIYMDSSWVPMGAHAAWNFTQNILLGLPNSGLVVPFSVYKVDAVSESPVYSVLFGLEGGYTCTAVMTLALVILIIWGEKNKKKPYDVWAEKAH